jgi:hypothetical protein
MEGISESERNFQLFKAGLSMVSCLTGEAIRILESNLKGLQGLFFGLKQWGVIMSICIEYHEKSLLKHKEKICIREGKIAESLTLPLIRNLRQLKDLCNKSKSEQTLLELNTFKFHIDYLSNMRQEQWTQDMLKTHIYIVIQQEMDNILNVLNPKVTEPLDRNQESIIRQEWTRVLSL